MLKLRNLIRAALALGLAGVATGAFAASPYTITPVSGYAEALGSDGSVVTQSTSQTQYHATSDEYNGWDNLYTDTTSVVSSTGTTTSIGTDAWVGPNLNTPWSSISDGAQSNVFSLANDQGVVVAPSFSVTNINASGAMTANLFDMGGTGTVGTAYTGGNPSGPPDGMITQTTDPVTGAAVYNANGTVTYLATQGTVSGLNSSGAVAYTDTSNIQRYDAQGNFLGYVNGAAAYLASGSTAPTVVADLGYGSATGHNTPALSMSGQGEGSSVNDTGQVTGGVFVGYQGADYTNNIAGTGFGQDNTRAFRTGANGVGTTVFGTANGVSSFGNVINNSGQVGGYITLASGQTEAFLTTAHGGLLVGLGAGAGTDSTAVDFLNNYGQAIISDYTTKSWYLYSAGYVVPITSLGANANDPVEGFNDAGQILLQDPQILTPTSGDYGSASAMSGYSGATAVTGTTVYQDVAAAQNNTTPDATFFSSPTNSTDTVTTTALAGTGSTSSLGTTPTISQSQYTPAAGVPEPGTLALLLLGVLAAFGLRRSARGTIEALG